jgi:hypothetical protein
VWKIGSITSARPAGQHGLDLGPVDGDEFGLLAGLFLPQAPQVDRIAFQLAVRIAVDVGRVVFVHGDAQRGGAGHEWSVQEGGAQDRKHQDVHDRHGPFSDRPVGTKIA